MKRSRLISIAAALIMFAVSPMLIYADQLNSVETIQLKIGDYLSRKYIEVLEKTHSPLAAERERDINLVVARKAQGATEVIPIMNFHEGGPVFQVDQSGVVKLKDSTGLDITSYTVQIINSSELKVGFNKYAPERFIFIKDMQRLIRKETVVGSYLDSKGRIYKFESDGVAITPSGTFRFTVGVDHGPYNFDYIEDSNTHHIYRFVRNKGRLDIYEVLDAVENQNGNDGSNAKLYASLRKIGE